MVKVAIDAMGGDFGCAPIIEGCLLALKTAKFQPILVGKVDEIKALIPADQLGSFVFVESNDLIAMSESATDALKRKESSIYKAVDLVATKQADAVVSAGHSGATMSLATLKIGRLPNVARPAIATLMPTVIDGKDTLVLDVGANVDSEAKHLFQFAIMGKAYAKTLMKIDSPKVGLLANGEEDSKGDKPVKETFPMLKKLRENGFNFVGNVEGNDIFKGTVDVVVCDGFAGNVLLKTAEGVADAIFGVLKKHVKKSPLSLLGAIFMKKAFRGLKKDMDYAEYGGAPLIGINGCAIVSHGKSNSKAMKNAILQAIKFVENGVNHEILSYLDKYQITTPKGATL